MMTQTQRNRRNASFDRHWGLLCQRESTAKERYLRLKERAARYFDAHDKEINAAWEHEKIVKETRKKPKGSWASPAHTAAVIRHQKKNPNQLKAQRALKDAVKAGKIVRPKECACCAKRCKPEAHHYLGYARRHWLTVAWVCGDCHRKLHS